MAFTTITVSTTVLPDQPAGPAVNGQAVFTLSATMRQPTGDEVVPTSIEAPITNGALSVELYANDDPATLPAGTTYSVQLELDGYPNPPTFRISVPHSSATGKAKLSAIKVT